MHAKGKRLLYDRLPALPAAAALFFYFIHFAHVKRLVRTSCPNPWGEDNRFIDFLLSSLVRYITLTRLLTRPRV